MGEGSAVKYPRHGGFKWRGAVLSNILDLEPSRYMGQCSAVKSPRFGVFKGLGAVLSNIPDLKDSMGGGQRFKTSQTCCLPGAGGQCFQMSQTRRLQGAGGSAVKYSRLGGFKWRGAVLSNIPELEASRGGQCCQISQT